MLAYIRGELVYVSPLSVVVETHGIGYKIAIPANVFSKLPQLGESVLLHTLCVMREPSQTLYGFLSVQERDLFELLLGVSGIGPKLGLSLVGHLFLYDLRQAIVNGNIGPICKVPGVGKKTAERLIIELRDKLAGFLPNDAPMEQMHEIPQKDKNGQRISDAMSALINLGYSQAVAQKAIKKSLQGLSEESDLAMLITCSLKHI